MMIKAIGVTLGIIMVLFGIIIATEETSAEVEIIVFDGGTLIELDTKFAESVEEMILNNPRVTSLESWSDLWGSITHITTTFNETEIEPFIIYLKGIEFKNEMNYFNTFDQPNNEPIPICIKDYNNNINGIYSVNNELFVLPNDERCPQ